MSPRGPGFLLSLILALTVGAGVVLFWSGPEPDSRPFQQLVGGLGLGPATDLADCAFAFDPRLSPDCSWNASPIPGGGCFCPHHACSVLAYPPLPPGSRTPEE